MKEEILTLLDEYISAMDEEMIELNDSGELEYWDSGNFDDCFRTGHSIGYDEAVLELAFKIKQIINK